MMASKGGTESLESLLTRLQALRVAIDEVEEASPGDRSKPFPPATEADIVAQEKRLRFPFPRSYRAFLQRHNGWRNFSYDWSVMGVSGPGLERADREWSREADKFARHVKRKGLSDVSEKSKSDPSIIFWPEHVPLAVDFNGGFRIFDRNRPHGGEYEIAEVYSGSEEALNREPDFIAVVKLAISIARRELSSHGRNPDAIEADAAGAAPDTAGPESPRAGSRKPVPRPQKSATRRVGQTKRPRQVKGRAAKKRAAKGKK
jgi:cell wall assembly regulator SMI1